MTCPWWARWWHRRCRRADRAVMLQTFREMMEAAGREDDNIASMWEKFRAWEQQAHWQCPCSKEEPDAWIL